MLRSTLWTDHPPLLPLRIGRRAPEIDPDVIEGPEARGRRVPGTKRRLRAGERCHPGGSSEAMRRTAEYTYIREQFDRRIATLQAAAMRAADAHIDVE